MIILLKFDITYYYWLMVDMSYGVPICDTVVVAGREPTIFELSVTKSVSIVVQNLCSSLSYCIGIVVSSCSVIFRSSLRIFRLAPNSSFLLAGISALCNLFSSFFALSWFLWYVWVWTRGIPFLSRHIVTLIAFVTQIANMNKIMSIQLVVLISLHLYT